MLIKKKIEDDKQLIYLILQISNYERERENEMNNKSYRDLYRE